MIILIHIKDQNQQTPNMMLQYNYGTRLLFRNLLSTELAELHSRVTRWSLFKPQQFPLQPTFPLLGWGGGGGIGRLACEINEKGTKGASWQELMKVLGKTVAARVRKRSRKSTRPQQIANPLLLQLAAERCQFDSSRSELHSSVHITWL